MPLLPLLLVALQTVPAVPEDLAILEARVVDAAGASIGDAGGPVHGIDRRLRLHRCPVPATIQQLRGGIVATCPVLGWRVHVALSGGGHGTAAGGETATAPIIRRGDAVLVRITGRGFAAGLRAVALEDGRLGARIRLRPNSSPTTPITAIVTGPGEATPAT